MSATKLASRYAKSLLDLAKEQGQLEAVYNDMAGFKAAVSNKEFYVMLKSPIINVGKKQQILKAIFETNVSALTMAFLNLICAKSREEYLPEIATEFENQYRALKGISVVKITTATVLDASAIDAIKANLIASKVISENVEVSTATNPNLIGGFVLEFDNHQYDASVARQLYLLKDKFDDNEYISQIMAR